MTQESKVDQDSMDAGRYSLLLSVDPVSWLDQKLAGMSELVSPILVKETRQALKSRQFFWTFFLLLAATATWSMLGYSLSQRDPSSTGSVLLNGYWTILAVPMGIIIPFTVFRSLASEYENDTIQLVTITTMKPYQIVIGKLGSAILQMVVFFSVLAPCISFTYLLRGVDLLHILFGLGVSLFGSLALSTIGLFLAGVKMSNVFRIGVSVLFMFGLLMSYFGFTSLMSELSSGYWPSAENTWSLLTVLCSAAFAIGLLAFTASSSQISFPADNRSTLNRLAMLVGTVVLVSMYGYVAVSFFDRWSIWLGHLALCQLWLLFGFMMIGENQFMSPRVRRELPRSVMGMSFLSFLVPGPGRGYLFAMVNIWGWTLAMIVYTFAGDTLLGNMPARNNVFVPGARWRILAALLCSLSFATLFLSANYLFVCFLSTRRKYLNPAITTILGVFSVLACVIVSMILHFSLLQPALANSYSGWQLMNWYWTSYQWLDFGAQNSSVLGSIVVAVGAVVLGLISLVIAARELVRRPGSVPDRVLQDDEELRPSFVAPEESIEAIFAERKEGRDNESSHVENVE